MHKIDITHYRTLTGAARKEAMRAYLTKAHGVTFALDPHAIPFSQQCALADMAKAVSWKKSISSSLSLGLAFYVYLSRDVVVPIQRTSRAPARRSPGITFGRAAA